MSLNSESDALAAARAFLAQRSIEFGECINSIAFPDGTITLHFAEPDNRSTGNDEFRILRAPQIIVVMVDRHTGLVTMPDVL